MTLPTLPAVLALPAYDAQPSVSIPGSRAAWESMCAAFVAMNALLPQIDTHAAAILADIQASFAAQSYGADPLGFTAATPPSNLVISSPLLHWHRVGRGVKGTARFTATWTGGAGAISLPGLPFPIVGQMAATMLLLGGGNLRPGGRLAAIGATAGSVSSLYLHDETNENAVPLTIDALDGYLDCVITVSYRTDA